ncbi:MULTISPECIES: putative phage abortive infection protein [Pirellulaceae]|uniref:putative phage abortive infection protein n=1 Tax=Pirellulaceae TaxID=2691357 RepID=UPI00130486CA|nr:MULTISPECIES: putative phage abortive infection protein [Pirellulaceae]
MSPKRDQSSAAIWWFAGLPSALAIFVLVTFVWNFRNHDISSVVEHWGQTGDFLGGILNPVLAFASLLVVCYTLRVQIRHASETARFTAIQRFEAFLFELLRLHSDTVASIDLHDAKNNRTTVGRDCFSAFVNWVRLNHGKDRNFPPTKESLVNAYNVFYERRKRKIEVGHYFRNLFHIFKYIDSSELLTDEQRIQYAKLVRAQLSVPETGLLFYNGLHPAGEGFRKYILKYTLLQELTADDLHIHGLSQDAMHGLYGIDAFVEK